MVNLVIIRAGTLALGLEKIRWLGWEPCDRSCQLNLSSKGTPWHSAHSSLELIGFCNLSSLALLVGQELCRTCGEH